MGSGLKLDKKMEARIDSAFRKAFAEFEEAAKKHGGEVEYTDSEALANSMLSNIEPAFDDAFADMVHAVYVLLSVAKSIGDEFGEMMMLRDVNSIFAKNHIEGLRVEVVKDKAINGSEKLN